MWGMTGWAAHPEGRVGDLVREFRAHPMNHQFQGEPLADFLLETDGGQPVAVGGPDPHRPMAGPVPLGDRVSGSPRVRRVVRSTATKTIVVSGSSSRVGSPDDERLGLTRDQVREIQKEYPGQTIPGDEYRYLRDHPVLMINVIWPYERPKDSKDKDAQEYLPAELCPIVALSMSLPDLRRSGRQGPPRIPGQ